MTNKSHREVEEDAEDEEEEAEPQQKNHRKSGSKWIWIGAVVLVFAIAIILIINQNQFIDTNNANPLSSDSQESQGETPSCKDIQVPYDYLEEYSETVPYTDQECEAKALAYSVDNTAFDYDTCNQQEDLCIKYFLGVCTEKKTYCIDRSVSCSLDLRNLDAEESGTWMIRYSFFEQGTGEVVKTSEISQYLYAQTTEKISGQVRIISQGETGDANRDVSSCNYQVLNVPTKQVCRDVIRYREITKTRTVTKYRTEQKCE